MGTRSSVRINHRLHTAHFFVFPTVAVWKTGDEGTGAFEVLSIATVVLSTFVLDITPAIPGDLGLTPGDGDSDSPVDRGRGEDRTGIVAGVEGNSHVETDNMVLWKNI